LLVVLCASVSGLLQRPRHRLIQKSVNRECPEGTIPDDDGLCVDPPTRKDTESNHTHHWVKPVYQGRIYKMIKGPPVIPLTALSHLPMHTPESMPRISTTVRCIILLATIYFVLYTAVAAVRAINGITSNAWEGVERYLDKGRVACDIAPMLAVLFLGARMRAILLTKGDTEKYNLPQPFVKDSMIVATFALAGFVALSLILPLIVWAERSTLRRHRPVIAPGELVTTDVESTIPQGALGTVESVDGDVARVAFGSGTYSLNVSGLDLVREGTKVFATVERDDVPVGAIGSLIGWAASGIRVSFDQGAVNFQPSELRTMKGCIVATTVGIDDEVVVGSLGIVKNAGESVLSVQFKGRGDRYQVDTDILRLVQAGDVVVCAQRMESVRPDVMGVVTEVAEDLVTVAFGNEVKDAGVADIELLVAGTFVETTAAVEDVPKGGKGFVVDADSASAIVVAFDGIGRRSVASAGLKRREHEGQTHRGPVSVLEEEREMIKQLHPPAMQYVFFTAQYLLLLIQVVAIALIVYGIWTMDNSRVRDEVWGGSPPAMSPAIACTVWIAVQFFVFFIAAAILETIVVCTGRREGTLSNLWETCKLAVAVIRVVGPMLCILFIATRLRAYQLDPTDGSVPEWVELAFYVCTAVVFTQAMILVLLGCTASKIREGECPGDFIVEDGEDAANTMAILIVQALRVVLLGILCGGILAICYAIITMEDAAGTKPPLPPAIGNAISLALWYFLILAILLGVVIIKVSGVILDSKVIRSGAVTGGWLDRTMHVFNAALLTVLFAPMLCVLFLAVRMRALQLTLAADGSIPEGAGPQCWAQEAMHMCTWSLIISSIMVIIIGFTMSGNRREQAIPSETKAERPNVWLAASLMSIRGLCLAAMYGGVVALLFAVTLMRPDTLPPWGPESCLIPGDSRPVSPMDATLQASDQAETAAKVLKLLRFS